MKAETAEKIAKIIPRLGGDDTDTLASVAAIKRVLESAGLTLHDLAKRVHAGDGFRMQPVTRAEMDDVFRPKPFKTNSRSGRPIVPADPSNYQFVIAVVPFLLDESLSENERQFVEHMRNGARRQMEAFRMTVPQRKRWTDILAHNGF
jgi:hypothetical protein